MSSCIQKLESLLSRELSRVVMGAEDSIRALVVALVARGHILVQGVPGLGKTLLAKTLARALGGEFKRVQGTPDLMPSDIIGVHVFDETQRAFVFRPGPAVRGRGAHGRDQPRGAEDTVGTAGGDGRAPGQRRSACLFAARGLPGARDSESPRIRRDVSAPGVAVGPVHAAHRYRLSGARGRGRHSVALRRHAYGRSDYDGGSDRSATLLLDDARAEAEQIHVSEALMGYVLDLANASREHPRLSLGLSTRGALALVKSARIVAGLRGADFATPDDVKEAAVWVIAHRLVLTPESALEGIKRFGRRARSAGRHSGSTMSLAQRAYVLIVATAVIAIAGIWSDDPALSRAWHIPAAVMLAGIAFEALMVRSSIVDFDVEMPAACI